MIVPFRGEYYDLVPDRASLVRALVYPVPDPRFPFLGVHFTRRISGKVDAGPNAILALAGEGYRHTHVNLRDLASSLSYPGFWRMARQHWRNGMGEWHHSLPKPALVPRLAAVAPRGTERRPGSQACPEFVLKPSATMALWLTTFSSCLRVRSSTC